MAGWQSYFVPGVILLYHYCFFGREGWDHLLAHSKTQLRSVCTSDTCPLNFSLHWRKTSQPRPDENKHSPNFFCGKDELKPKLIYLKNLRKKQKRFFKKPFLYPHQYVTCRSLTKKTSVALENTKRNPCYVRLQFPGAGKGERIRSLYSWTVFISYQECLCNLF